MKIIPMCAYSNDIVICRKVLLSGQLLNRAHNFQIQSVRIPLTFYSTTKSCPTFRSTPKACPTFLSIPTRGGSRISSKEGRGALKKLRRAEGGAKIVEVFHVKNHDFTPKNPFFFQF
jgi:hypothetical protein